MNQQLIVCGCGHGGHSAALEAVFRGTPANQVLILERDAERLRAAADCDFVGLMGDATHEQDLTDAGVAKAKAVIVCLGRDDAAVLTVLTIRQLNPKVRVICSVSEQENLKLIRQAGADAIVAPSIVGGYLMADSLESSHIADYIDDLMCSDGRVRLAERAPSAAEIGKPMRGIGPGIVVRIHRAGERIGFWEGERAMVQAGDVLLQIPANPGFKETVGDV